MLNRIWALIIKELQALLRDPRSRRLLIIPVILQISLFPFAATLEVKNNVLAIYNQDGGKESVDLIQHFAKAKAFSKLLLLYSNKEVRECIDNQQALLVVIFPEDFSRKIESQQTAFLQAIIDGRHSNAAQIAFGYIQEIVQQFNLELQKQKGLNIINSKIVVRNWFNPNLDYKWFILPSLIGLITTLGCLIVTAMSVAREREQGTFEQLLVSPLTPGYIMIGKIVPALIVALSQASMILLASIFIYQIPFQGSIFLLYFSLFCYAIALSGIGLFISSLSSTQQQAFLGVFGFTMPAIILSGYISPIENIPEPLRSITWLNPIRHFIVISKGIYLKAFNFTQIWHELWSLLIIAGLTLSMAYIIFKRNIE